MALNPDFNDRLRSVLVMLATAGTIAYNGLAAGDHFGGLSTGANFDRYPSILTPAVYAFSIWSFIYFGLAAFAVYQLLPANLVRFRDVRTIYIASCALNCGWLYFSLNGQIGTSLVLMFALLGTLILIVRRFGSTETTVEVWVANAPFGLYAGWVAIMAIVKVSAYIADSRIELSASSASLLGSILILLAAATGIVVRWRFTNYLYPWAIAWGLTAIAIKQSGNTAIVVTSAIGVITCLVAALSFVMSLPVMERNLGSNE